MLPPSAQAARDRRDARQEGYRPTIVSNRLPAAPVDPFAGQPSLTQRTTASGVAAPLTAPSATESLRQALPVDPFAGQRPLSERTRADNLGGRVPFSPAQKSDIGKSLVDGSPRPSFSSINLPPTATDPVVSGFSSLSGVPANQVVPKKKPAYSVLGNPSVL